MSQLPMGMSIDNFTVAGIEEAKMRDSIQGFENRSINQSAISIRNIVPPHEKMLKTVQESITKTRKVVNQAQSSNASNAEIKVYNIDDSQISN